MSPLKKRVMSSTKSTPWQEVKSNCKEGSGQLLAEAYPQASPSCSCRTSIPPPSPLPGGLSRPHSSPLSLNRWGTEHGAPPSHLPPTGPGADLGLEAEDGDGEADEGRDAQAQQHRGGVVVAAGAQARGQPVFDSPGLPPRPTLLSRPAP